MAKLKTAKTHELVYYGHDTLKKVAEDVKEIDDELLRLIDTMFNVMYREKGVGLAAPQIDESRRLIVIDVADEKKKSQVLELINPVITASSDEVGPYEEGCLSVPGISEEIIRPTGIQVRGITRDGKEVSLEMGGMLARVTQHEVDHLNGILFVDRLEDYVRNELRPELKRIKKLNKRP
ncbi:MAG TPA: peptide deformylase [Spirochaetota bacterium]|nr:peptide deformylase [Spirochaetota bacterium]HPG49648.1 peptide deformylase [Spirochaetota bacterium]HPN10942.1 peptide deformylase [Spirochaetota bacterium]HQL83781.1 peptide deformylase [Spirochaetota bacterium]